MSFRFRALVVASPPSIKDWARGSAAADRAGILVATAPLLDAAAGGEGARAGEGACAVAGLEARRRRLGYNSRKPSPWEGWILQREAWGRRRAVAAGKPDEAP